MSLTKHLLLTLLLTDYSQAITVSPLQLSQSNSQAQWLVPCSNKLCRNFLQNLNPSDQWVKDKGNSMDHEDDGASDENGNGQQQLAAKGKKKVKYGHASLEKNKQGLRV